MQARLANAEERTDEAVRVLDDAEERIRSLEIAEAKKLLAEAREVLSDRDVSLHPEGDTLRVRLTELNAELELAEVEKKKRDLEFAVLRQKEKVERALAALRQREEELSTPTVARITAVREAAREVVDELQEGKELAAKDKPYAAYVKEVEYSLEQSEVQAVFAEKLFAFREGPAAARMKGFEAAQAAKEASVEKKVELLSAAHGHFQACATEGRAQLASTPTLAKAPVVAGEKVTAKTLVAECQAKLRPTAKQLAAAQKKLQQSAKKPVKKKARKK